MNLEDDWQVLKLRQPLPEKEGAWLEDLEESWDELQGERSIFVSLFSKDGKEVPGSRIRVKGDPFSQPTSQLFWPRLLVAATVTKIGYARRGCTLRFVPFEKPINVEPNHPLCVEVKNHQRVWIEHLYSGATNSTFTLDTLNSGVNSTNNTFTIPVFGSFA